MGEFPIADVGNFRLPGTGHVGVAEFLLALHKIDSGAGYLDFTRRITTDLIGRATETASGTSWVQAEHRTRPELLGAQTGYMQGAAGIGTYLLHLDGVERGADPQIVLPDCAF